MLKVTKKMEYALMALRYMAAKDRPSKSSEQLISTREICDLFKIPFDTMAKVMQVMNMHDILTSVKGMKGGYSLKMNLKNLTYFHLHQLIEGTSESICVGNKGLCELHNDCNIVAPMERLNNKINQYLLTLDLQELLFGEGSI